jgi:F-type H+-transporting ATPase subunit b
MTRLLPLAIAWLAPAIVWAASPEAAPPTHGDEHGGGLVWVTWPPWGDHGKTGIVWLLINFAVLMYILEKLLFRKLRARTAEKHDLIKGELTRATEARNEAESLIREYRDRVARLDGEIEELMADAKKRADADRVAVIAAAEEEGERIKLAAKAAAEREAASRRRAIENEIVERAVDRAEQIIRQRIAPVDQSRMLDDYIGQLDRIDLGQGRSSGGSR